MLGKVEEGERPALAQLLLVGRKTGPREALASLMLTALTLWTQARCL